MANSELDARGVIVSPQTADRRSHDSRGITDRGTSNRYGELPRPRIKGHVLNGQSRTSADRPGTLNAAKVAESGAVHDEIASPNTPKTGDTGRPTKTKDPAIRSIPVGEDDKLRLIAEQIAEKWYWVGRDLRRPMWVMAESALHLFKTYEPRMDEARLRRVLKFLKNHTDAYAEFWRQTRNPDLGDYLASMGVSWDEMLLNDLPAPGDWAMFAVGAAEGVMAAYVINAWQLLMLPKDIIKAIYVAVGRRWDPALEQTYQNFTTALATVLNDIGGFAAGHWHEAMAEIQAALRRRQYRDAGVLLGNMAANILFIAEGARSLGEFGIKIVAHLPKLGAKAIQKLGIANELMRFYLSGHTREILPSGTAFSRVEKTVIVAKGSQKPFSVRFDELSQAELEELRSGLSAEREWPALKHSPSAAKPWRQSGVQPPLPTEGVGRSARGIGSRGVEGGSRLGESTTAPPIHEYQLSREEHLAARNTVFPGQYLDQITRAVDGIGQRAALSAVRDPRFLAAIRDGDMRLGGILFHSRAAREARILEPGSLPPGWTITAEEVIQSGAGGSRTDVLLRGPGDARMEFDWKTTGRSAISHASRSEMERHAGHITTRVGGTLTAQESRSWVDYVRPLLPGHF